MGLSNSSLNKNNHKTCFMFYHIARYHVIHHVVRNHVEKITSVFLCLISIHTKMLTATAMKMKMQMKMFQNTQNTIVMISILFASVVQVVVQVVRLNLATRLLLDFYSNSTRLLLEFYSTGTWLQHFLLSKFTCRPVDSTSTRILLDFYSNSTRQVNGYSSFF